MPVALDLFEEQDPLAVDGPLVEADVGHDVGFIPVTCCVGFAHAFDGVHLLNRYILAHVCDIVEATSIEACFLLGIESLLNGSIRADHSPATLDSGCVNRQGQQDLLVVDAARDD